LGVFFDRSGNITLPCTDIHGIRERL